MKHTTTSVRSWICAALLVCGLPIPVAQAGPWTAPKSPGNLKVSASHDGAKLTWSDRSNNETGFRIRREKFVGIRWASAEVFTTGPNVSTYKDVVEPGLYRYTVCALGSKSHSAYTIWRIAKVTESSPSSSSSGATAPAAPTGVAVSDIGGGRAMVTWTDASSNESGFMIERNPVLTARVITAGPDSTAFIDTCGNGTFQYRVAAFNASGSSPYGQWVTVSVTSGGSTGGTGGSSGGSKSDTGGSSGGSTGGPAGGTGGSSGGSTGGSTGGTGGSSGGSTGGTGGSSGGSTGGTGGSSGGSTGGTGGSPGGTNPDPGAGWTQFTPSADSRVIYVSTSGNDSNNGLSEASPKRTLGAAYGEMRDGYPDWILLKAGNTWNEGFPYWNKTGRSEGEPMRIGMYGSGERPTINSGDITGFYAGNWTSSQRSNIAVTDLKFLGTGRAIEIRGNWSNVLIENVHVEKFFTNIVFEADPNSQNLANIKLRRSVVADAYAVGPSGHAQGIYAGGVKGLLLEECVFDHNGWSETISGAVPTIFRHNIYLQADCSNVTTRGIISARAGATGMQQRSGGHCEGHLFLQNPLNMVFGGGGVVRDCVVLDSRDIDAANPRGIGIQISGGTNHEIYNNICAWRTTPGTWNISAYSADNAWGNAWFHDNVAWKWRAAGAPGSGMEVWGQPVGWMKLTNNSFQQLTGGDVLQYHVSAPLTLSGNKYYSTAATAFEKNGSRMAFPQWVTATAESNSAFSQDSFPDPDRTIATYMASLGKTASLDAFMTEARKQSRTNWRQEYTAKAVNDYIRAGFGKTATASQQ